MNATTRTLREPTAVPFNWGGETLFVPDHLVEVFDDVVATLGLDARPVPPTAADMVEWARDLRLEAGRVERSHQGDKLAREERAEALRREATVLLSAGTMLLARRGQVVRLATRDVAPGDVLRVSAALPLLTPGAWVVEDIWGVVSLTKLDTLGRRTGVSVTLTGGNLSALLALVKGGERVVVVERGEVA